MIRKFENKDCMIGMSEYPDEYFDLAIVDPEYGIKLKGPCGHFQRYGTLQKMNTKPPDREYFDELFRVSKNQIIFGGNYFALPKNRCFLIWDKGPSMYRRSFAECEYAWTSFDDVARMFRIHPRQKDRFHPTQKPIPLYRWILQNYAKSGDLILDTHVGSASSLIACEMEGFEYVGFEIDEEYYKAAVERINKFRARPDMFADKTHRDRV